MRLLSVLALMAFSSFTGSCDDPSTSQNVEGDVQQNLRSPPKIPIMIRNWAGTPKQRAFLVAPTPDPQFDQLATAMRGDGFRCDGVTDFKQLEDSTGAIMTIYKLDCGRRSYQVTVVNGETHIKRWTGNIFGQ